jgi:hypothetical protein
MGAEFSYRGIAKRSSLVRFILVLSLLVCGACRVDDQEYHAVVAKLKHVKLGATKQEVRDMVGAPARITNKRIGKEMYEIWTFPHDAFAAEVPQCTFLATTGRVILVTADEDYEIGRYPGR